VNILVVEDDAQVAAFIVAGLRQSGHVVALCTDGRQGLLQATTEPFDLIILDRMLPFVDGLKIVQTLRATGDKTAVLFLSALGDVDERVKGLKAGGDDYLAKPFAMSELLARVEALGRRPLATDSQRTDFVVGGLTIDLLAHEVTRAGQKIDLTPREFRILQSLAESAGRVVTRSMLLEQVWDYSFDPQTNIIDQHISKLRHKIDRGQAAQLIHTVRGSGYALRVS
jgi:two-component system OmpR family response regulator